MKSENRQTMILIGVALIIIAGLLLYVGWSQPRVYEEITVADYKHEGIAVNPRGAASESVSYFSAIDDKDELETEQQYSYPINLNTATYDELVSIKGIGDVKANAILEYRDHLGKYTSVEQIKEIYGIDEAFYKSVAEYLTV